MASLWRRLMLGLTAGYVAFKEEFLSAGVPRTADFDSLEARLLRYALYWAMYENTAYREIHSWARSFRAQYGLYDFVRGIYNPTHRIGEAWRVFIWGGRLDSLAGTGDPRIKPSAIPIITENESLRPVLSQIWKHSNWAIKKDLVPLYGSVLGDCIIKVVDNPQKKRVYLVVEHPGPLVDVVLDEFGFVKAYTIQEEREDDENPGTAAVYTEKCYREGPNVVYITYKGGNEHAWYADDLEKIGVEPLSRWSEPYGFVPMVLIQHNDIGKTFGEPEIMAGLPKFNELNDLASKLSDQIRKAVHVPWLFAGVKKGKTDVQFTAAEPTATKKEPAREQVNALFVDDPNARPWALVAELRIEEVAGYMNDLLKELERDYPELQMDIWTWRGDSSSKALRVARQRVESKVEQRRAVYDDALVRAHQMAVSIGAMKEYPGFEDFSDESYENGDLDHSVGIRGAFLTDPLDRIETEEAFWTVAKLAVDSGADLRGYLEREKVPHDELEKLCPPVPEVEREMIVPSAEETTDEEQKTEEE